MTSKHTPVANATLPFWRTDPHPLDNHRSTETLPEQTDVVIIGAGYAGASVAHHILRKVEQGAKAPSITILEARQACSGATARNGGHMKPDIYNFVSTLAAEYGVDAAAEVAAFEAKHVYAMKDFIEAERINCDYSVTKAVDVQLSEEHFKKLKDRIKHLLAGGSKATAEAQIIESQQAEAVRRFHYHWMQVTSGPTNSFSMSWKMRSRKVLICRRTPPWIKSRMRPILILHIAGKWRLRRAAQSRPKRWCLQRTHIPQLSRHSIKVELYLYGVLAVVLLFHLGLTLLA